MTEPGSRPSNRLAGEKSAYLRQHMHNPVDWYPWGDEALETARREDRPLLISIGYSACHWCHVMERESFEDSGTAELMNRHFVCIKVDREERPDVDQIYMDTVTRLTGHGGWPLTVFCTPAGEPFYGGTYYPPEPRHGLPSFRQLLESVAQAYRDRRGEVQKTADQILASLTHQPTGRVETQPGANTVERGAMALLRSADPERGGFGTAPRFPTPCALDLLLASSDVLPERKAREALEHVALTCREMSRGGMYDHLGGGFHRYSVDAYWRIPHFEKMLYDQGQLLRTYAETWRRTGDEDLSWPMRETAEFLRREMTDPDGGFYASQDADSEGEEGRFYAWTPAEIETVLGSDAAAAFCADYDVTAGGSFEHGTSVLHDVAREPRARFTVERETLLRVREKRVAPATDRKRVASWNGFAISGLARAGSLLGDAAMLRDASAAAEFVLSNLFDDQGRLCRVFDGGRSDVPGFLDDVAAMLEACLDLHRAGAGSRYWEAAVGLADQLATRFYDENEGDFFLTPADGQKLVHRPRSDHDGATPHSAGLAALGLHRVATLSGREDLGSIVGRVLDSHAFLLDRAPEAFHTLARVALAAERGLSVAVVLGDPNDEAARALADRARRVLLPDDAVLVVTPGDPAPAGVDAAWLAGRELREGRATAYVCRGVTCSLPATSPDELTPLS